MSISKLKKRLIACLNLLIIDFMITPVTAEPRNVEIKINAEIPLVLEITDENNQVIKDVDIRLEVNANGRLSGTSSKLKIRSNSVNNSNPQRESGTINLQMSDLYALDNTPFYLQTLANQVMNYKIDVAASTDISIDNHVFNHSGESKKVTLVYSSTSGRYESKAQFIFTSLEERINLAAGSYHGTAYASISINA